MTTNRKSPSAAILLHLLLLLNLSLLSNGFSSPLTKRGRTPTTPEVCTQPRAPLYPTQKPQTTTTKLRLTTTPTTPPIPATQNSPAQPPPPKPEAKYDSIITGAGPAGLLSAIMLARLYGPSHRIAVLERRSTPPPDPSDATIWNSDVARFYLLGIGFRGQDALREFGVMEDFEKVSVAVNGRYDWQPGMKTREEGRISAARKEVVSRVLPRDKLVAVLHRHILENYADASIDLLYGYECQPIGFGETDDDVVTVRIVNCDEVPQEANDSAAGTNYVPSQASTELCDVEFLQITRTNLLIAADGSARTVANAIEAHDRKTLASVPLYRRLFAGRPFRVKRYEDDNVQVYKSVRIQLPEDYPHDLNYSNRQSRVNLEALPADSNGTLCALLLMRPDEPFAQPNADPVALREYFDEELPLFSKLIPPNEMDILAQKPPSSLPKFRYVGPRLNCEGRTVVLGDAAHTVKPYYGLGANSALEDVRVLAECLREAAQDGGNGQEVGKSVPKAVRAFSDRRAEDSAALVTMSRNMDRPGFMSFACFVLPLILDGMFHKLAPRVFGPNMFAMFQRRDLTFRDIQRKKRLDRAMQVGIVGVALGSLGVGVARGLGLLLRVGMGLWRSRGVASLV